MMNTAWASRADLTNWGISNSPFWISPRLVRNTSQKKECVAKIVFPGLHLTNSTDRPGGFPSSLVDDLPPISVRATTQRGTKWDYDTESRTNGVQVPIKRSLILTCWVSAMRLLRPMFPGNNGGRGHRRDGNRFGTSSHLWSVVRTRP